MAEQVSLLAGHEVLQYVPALLAAGRHHRQHSLHERAPRVALGPATGLAPDHRMPQRTLCRVVRRIDSLDTQEGPEVGLAFQELSASCRCRGARALCPTSQVLTHCPA